MNSRFKFPRRVRIHGGECGAVARALHHEAQEDALMSYEQTLVMTEVALLRQADSGKALGSTFNERKQMSTKTTLKRIALVAVSALGFGVLTSVAPASATATYAGATSITVGASTASRVGVASTTAITLNGTYTVDDTVTVSAKVISSPAGSVFATSRTSGNYAAGIQGTGTPNAGVLTITAPAAQTATTAFTGTVTGAGSASATDENYVTNVFTLGATGTSGTTLALNVNTTVDVAGTYQVLVSVAATNRAQAEGSFVAGDVSAIYTFTTAGAPATITMTPVGSTADTETLGRLVRITLKDANGNATVPGDAESINLSSDKTTTYFGAATSGNPSSNPTATTLGLGTANFYATGSAALVRVLGAAGTTVVTATGGGTIPTSVTTQGSLTFLASTLTSSAAVTISPITATVAYPENGYGVATAASSGTSNLGTIKVAPTSTSRSWRVVYTNTSTSAAAVARVTVTDISGLITGVANATYTQSVSIAAKGTATDAVAPTGANFTVSTLSALINGASYSVKVTGDTTSDTNLGYTVSGETSTSTASTAKVAAVGVTAFTAAPASTVTQTVKLTDQFGAAVANAAITVSISGRNAAKSGAVIITDASGLASYALTDAGTSGTTDTLEFSSSSATKTAASTTITWGTVTVSTVTLNGGNTTAGVADATKTIRDINAGDGVESTTYGITATVKDANGVLLGGVPVEWSISGTGAAITSTTIKGTTTSAGVHTAKVYGWIAGDYTVTAKAGAVTATGTITFGQTVKGDERTISATVSGPIVTAKTVDRFGNPVPGVIVYATKTGVGYFGSGVTKTSGTTGSDGTVEFVVAGGSADVTVSTIDYAAAAGTYGSGQTSAPKGYTCNAATATALAACAFTATVAGTATKDEVGVGASFDGAGVASATVKVAGDSSAADAANAAADAAAEAIDAANAATDAANLAAEAADAATVAAEEARDAADAATAAVEELATQVATLMAALKAQITTLANTVAKIAKKVRA